jgi:hypothetical protein
MNLSRFRALSLISISTLIAGGAMVAQAQTPTAAVDVVGIKIGMPLKDAIEAIKADNPKLGLQNQTLQVEGFDQPFVISEIADQPGESGKDKESITLLVTTPPGDQTIWGIRRTYSYSNQTAPSLDNTLAGLRKKYGPESVFLNPDERDMTKNMVWVYDASGKPVAAAEARGLYLACTAYLENHFGSVSLQNDLAGMKGPAECNSIMIATASVQAGRLGTDTTPVVNNLLFMVANGAMFHSSLDATRAVAVGAKAEREKKQNQTVDQRGAPKL